jgi:hypothetical protein
MGISRMDYLVEDQERHDDKKEGRDGQKQKNYFGGGLDAACKLLG